MKYWFFLVMMRSSCGILLSIAVFHKKGSPPRNHLPYSDSIKFYGTSLYVRQVYKSHFLFTYHKLLTLFEVEVSHDKLVHAEVHG